jgi:flagellar basal-body rod protein FlgB
VVLGKDLTSRILERGIQAATLRQQALAHNVANVNTPGFKRVRVDFEAELARALKERRDPDTVKPTVVVETQSIGRPDGNNVDIELEMTQMAENQIWYAALVRQLNDQFNRLRMVIHDGRR